MTSTQATAQVFWAAFKALRKKERIAVVQRLLQDEELGEDLRYAAAIEARKHEPRISLTDYLAERAAKPR